MNLINEIVTIILLLIIINIIFAILSSKKNNIAEKKADKEEKEEFIFKINKIKNILILIFGIVTFATLIDIYNIFIKNVNSYIHIFGIFNFAKISTNQLNVMYIFSIGQFLLYLEIVLLLLINKKSIKNIITAILVLIYIGLCVQRLYVPYQFYKDAEKYKYIDNIDIIKDFEEDDEISKNGAIKIIKKEFEVEYIRNVEAELVNIDEVEDINIKYSCDFEDFWIITFDYMRNYEIKENVSAYVDLYTGEVAYLTY